MNISSLASITSISMDGKSRLALGPASLAVVLSFLQAAPADAAGNALALPAAPPALARSLPVKGSPIVLGRKPGQPARVRDAGVLDVAVTPDEALLSGGDGVATVALARVSAEAEIVRNVRLRISLTRGVRARSATAPGWACVKEGRHDLACRVRTRAVSTTALPPIRLQLDARPGDGGRALLVVRGAWTQPAQGRLSVARSASRRLVLSPKAPLTVRAKAVEDAVADPIAGQRATSVVLRGSVRRRTAGPIRYRWRQVCGKGRSCPRVRWTTVKAGVLNDGQQPIAAFAAPQVKRSVTLRFALDASDARGRVVGRAKVRVLPQAANRLNPRLAKTKLASRQLRSLGKPGEPFRLSSADRAHVDINGRGSTEVKPSGVVRLSVDVRGESERRVGWSVIRGPPGLLADAKRDGRSIRFRAPDRPGALLVRARVRTRTDSFTHDELVELKQAQTAGASSIRHRHTSARRRVRTTQDDRRKQTFCNLVEAARRGQGEISLPLSSGGKFTADAKAPSGSDCTGSETVEFASGSSTLGGFELQDLRGTITLERGLAVRQGTLVVPDFWAQETVDGKIARKARAARARDVKILTGRQARQAARASQSQRLSIGFSLPQGEGLSVGLGSRLETDGGWGDLTGDLSLSQGALDELPIGKAALPSGWQLTELRLGVNPDSHRFELSAGAKGPGAQGRDARMDLDGELTFDGQVRVEVIAANLAVLQSREGQTAVSASGSLTLLPGRKFTAAGTPEGPTFPVVDVEVSGQIGEVGANGKIVNGYEPAEGVKLAGQVAWSSDGPLDVSGTLEAATRGNDIRVGVAGTYTDAQNWTLRGELSTEGGLRLGNLLTLERLQGSITRTGGTLGVDFTGRVTDIRGIEGVRARDAEASLTTSDCGLTDQQEQGAKPLRVCLSLDTTVEVALPGSTQPLEFNGGVAIQLPSLKFRVSGRLGSSAQFGPEALRLRNVEIWATNATASTRVCQRAGSTGAVRTADSQGVSFGFTAEGRVLGVDLNDVTGAYLSDGSYCLGAKVPDANLPRDGSDSADLQQRGSASPGCAADDAPLLQGMSFSYFSTPGKGSFDGRFCLPSGLRDKLGTPGKGTGTVHLDVTTTSGAESLNGSVRYTLDQPYWLIGAKDPSGTTPDETKAALAFRSMGLTLNVSRASVTLGLDAQGTLRLPDPSSWLGGDAGTQPANEAPLSVTAIAKLDANPSLTMATVLGESGQGAPCTAQRKGALRDVFGQKGFTVCQLGVSGTLSASPSLQASAEFTLPTAWNQQLGTSNASFSLAFSVSASRPCFDLGIVQGADRTKPAADLFNKGALTTNEAHLRVAPSGCDLPRNGTTASIAPGFKLSFDGTVVGTPLKVSAEMVRRGDSFKFDGTFNVGRFALGPLQFGDTDIGVHADPLEGGGSFSVTVKTSMALGSGEFKLDAAFSSSGSGDNRELSLKGTSSANFQLAGATFNGSMTLDYKTSKGGTDADFSGELDANLKVFTIHVKVDTLKYRSSEGGLRALDVKGRTTASIGPGSLAVSGAVTYSRAANKLHLGFGGSFSLWGVYSRSVTLDVDLGPIEFPFSIGVAGGAAKFPAIPVGTILRFTGALSGALTWSPNSGFGVKIAKPFQVQYCDLFEVGCLEVAKVDVDHATGKVTARILGIPIDVGTGDYTTAGPDRASTEGDGVLVNGQDLRCLDVRDRSTADGTPLQMYQCNATPAQQFKLLPNQDLRVLGKCVDARGPHNPPPGEAVTLHTCNRDATQEWSIDDHGRLVGLHGRCMEIYGDPKDERVHQDRADMVKHTCDESKSNQRFAMGGAFRFEDTCMDLPKASTAKGTEIQRHECNRTAAQSFSFGLNGQLKVMDRCVVAGDRKLGDRLKIEPCDGARVDRWTLRSGRLGLTGTKDPRSGGDPGLCVSETLTLKLCRDLPLGTMWAFGRVS